MKIIGQTSWKTGLMWPDWTNAEETWLDEMQDAFTFIFSSETGNKIKFPLDHKTWFFYETCHFHDPV